MSQEKINQRLIKSNIDQLSKIVKRPAVTEKILSRPPFRFLFDLTTMIIKTTGYLRGLYSEDEFNFDHVNSNKESKMAFLDKLIDAIGFINGKTIDCKSTKIVAGVEVDKTNKLLNEFAKCVLDKKPFLEAVDKVRKGQKNINDKKLNNNNNNNNKEKTITKTSNSDVKSKTITKQTINSNNKAKQSTKNSVTTKTTNQKTSIKNENEISENNNINNNKESIDKIENNNDSIKIEDEVIEETQNIDSPYSNRPSTAIKTNIMNDNESKIEENNNQLDIKTISAMDDLDNVLEQLSSLSNNTHEMTNENNPTILSMPEPQILDEELYINNNNNVDERNLIPENESENNQLEQSITDVPQNHNFFDKQQKEPQDVELLIKKNNEKTIQLNRLKNHEFMNQNSLISNDDVNNKNSDSNVNNVDKKITAKTNTDNNERIKSGTPKPRTARPKSSRPAPPRVMTATRSRLSQVMENRTEQLGTESTATNANVWIPETVDDETDEFLISSKKLQDSFLTKNSNDVNNNEQINIDGNEEFESKGHLVQQLIATKNELEGQIKDSNFDSNKTNYKQSSISNVNSTNQLKNQIQSLCQSIGTLTKAMGYLHEDVEPMLDELVKWQTEFNMNNKIIMKIRSDINNDLEPLRKELEQIEHQVDDLNEHIRLVKSNLFRNEQIISNLINNV